MAGHWQWLVYYTFSNSIIFTLEEQHTHMNLLLANFLYVEPTTCWFLFWFFSSWNLYTDFYPHETDFVHGTSCMLNLVRKTFCKLIFLFVKLVHWFFSSWNWFCSRNFLRAYFCSLNLLRADFCKWNLLQVYFCLRETYTWIFFSLWSWLFFMKIVADWFCVSGTYCMQFVFVHETCCMLILNSWNLYSDFSSRETDFAHRTCCTPIFGSENCCMLIFHCSWNLYLDFFFNFVKLILFIELFRHAETNFVGGTYCMHWF